MGHSYISPVPVAVLAQFMYPYAFLPPRPSFPGSSTRESRVRMFAYSLTVNYLLVPAAQASLV